MSWLAQQFGLRHPDNWYRVTTDDFRWQRGRNLLATFYDGSIANAAREIRPDNRWWDERFQSPSSSGRT